MRRVDRSRPMHLIQPDRLNARLGAKLCAIGGNGQRIISNVIAQIEARIDTPTRPALTGRYETVHARG